MNKILSMIQLPIDDTSCKLSDRHKDNLHVTVDCSKL